MARKSKTQNKENLDKSKEVQNSSAITLGGNVTVKIYKNKTLLNTIKLNNTATDLFLQSISQLVSGFGSNMLPMYLGIGNSPAISSWDMTKHTLDNEYINRRVMLNKQSIQTKTIDGNIVYVSRYSATLSYNWVTGFDINEIGLFASDTGDTLLARVKFANSLPQLTTGMSEVIEWNINIGNKV